ncbi:50S ribosome-binding GTPase [Peribacillus frigoritolerans]|uniref:GTPase n=1 Tax=Peribacillus frigoritolerans TaxID=450367 RepID=UPI002E1B3B5C|nr:GTPase [Peribacillus frigoritolerans]MED3888345.1 50S ribosome-binding GTPase [Peribacillus frigoritolerans]
MREETKQEDFWEDIFSEMKEEFNKFNENFDKNFIKPNIVLSGKTGVGKSTLINAIFGSKIAKAGEGKPVSQSLIKYDIADINVNLFDTKGLELDPQEREKSRNSIIGEISKRAESSKVEEHMHVMWYCISNESRRIEDVELEWIKDFSNYMPVIVVLTQTLDTDETFQRIIEQECPEVKICRVLAEERKLFENVIIPPHGLKNLISETMNILPDATVRAFTAAQKIKIEEKIKSAKELLKERLDSKGPFNYKNLAHLADTLPIGLDVLGKGAVYLYIAKDIMTVMGIPVSKNFIKFSKEAKSLLKSILLPFILFEGSKTAGKAAVKYGSEKFGPKVVAFISKLLGKTIGKSNIILSPVVGLIIGSFNRKVTEKIANVFIDVCSDFLRSEQNFEELSNEEILDILSKNMQEKMEDIQESLEEIVEEELTLS